MKKTIKEVVESYGVKLWSISDGVLRGSCPMHTNVNTPSFTVYVNTDSYFCFGESIGGDTANFISRMEGISYAEAKDRIKGDTNLLEEITETLDGLSVKDEINYADELNFSISKYCRDLMYRRADKVDNILKFLQKLDKEYLTKSISYDILNRVTEESKQLENL
jgi:hypothetical protein